MAATRDLADGGGGGVEDGIVKYYKHFKLQWQQRGTWLIGAAAALKTGGAPSPAKSCRVSAARHPHRSAN